MKIRRLEKKDIPSIEKLENDIFGYTLGENYFNIQIQNEYSAYFVMVSDNDIVGYIGSTSEEMAEIQNFCISKDYQSKGYGKELLEYLINYLKDNNSKSIYLEVNYNNIRAINLYKKYGFEVNRIRKNYYKGEDALVMIKKLGD